MKKSKKIILFDIDYTIFDTASFKESKESNFVLYNEVLDTFSQLEKIADFGIFSEGNISFQHKKLKETDIEKYFPKEHVHIFEQKNDMLKKVLELYSDKANLYFVDDKLSVLHLAKKFEPSVFTIWVKRGFYARKQLPIEGFTPDGIVTALHEIVPLIAKE